MIFLGAQVVVIALKYCLAFKKAIQNIIIVLYSAIGIYKFQKSEKLRETFSAWHESLMIAFNDFVLSESQTSNSYALQPINANKY